MNTNIRRLATIMVLAVVALVLQLSWWQVMAADELTAKMPFNAPRALAAEQNAQRGAILDRKGRPLAWSEQTPDGAKRVYAEPSLVHALGYYSYRFGSTNIEQAFDSYLQAESGLTILDRLRRDVFYEPVKGADVVTTLDLDLQRAADKALGDQPGAIVAINPRTGEILALASHPYFDPNQLDSLWEQLINDPAKPLVNRAAGGLYVPGSTFKTLTLAAALDAGVVTPETTFENKGDFTVEGFHIVYTNPPGHPFFNLSDAFAYSVNAAFADIGLRLGADKLQEAAARFGLGQAIPLKGIPTAVSEIETSPGFLNDKPALASTAFGQGELSITPLQMALVSAAVANGGNVPRPYVVSEVRRADGQVVYRDGPQTWQRAMSEGTARIIDDMMVYSVDVGYAKTAQIAGVKVGGKTGTAETSSTEESHSWFIGYAPADNPTIAVAVICEHGGPGSTAATPEARQVIQAWLDHQ
ncbi:MAG: peptidoglycan D,D-transpeptidase FtsI family protein [Chloroflexota bacterium]